MEFVFDGFSQPLGNADPPHPRSLVDRRFDFTGDSKLDERGRTVGQRRLARRNSGNQQRKFIAWAQLTADERTDNEGDLV